MGRARPSGLAKLLECNGCQCHAATTLHGHPIVTDRGDADRHDNGRVGVLVQSNIIFFILFILRLFETTYSEPYPNQNILQNGRGQRRR